MITSFTFSLRSSATTKPPINPAPPITNIFLSFSSIFLFLEFEQTDLLSRVFYVRYSEFDSIFLRELLKKHLIKASGDHRLVVIQDPSGIVVHVISEQKKSA